MSEPASIIRQESEHSVTVSEGSLVATSKPSDPTGPVVRQNLAGEEGDRPSGQEPAAPDLPPPVAASSEPEALVFQRRHEVQTEDASDPAPAASESPSAPVFERRLEVSDAQVQDLPPGDADAQASAAAPVFERRLEIPEAPAQEIAASPDGTAADVPVQTAPADGGGGGDSLQLPAALDGSQQSGESAVDRFLRERRLAAQAEQGESSDPAQGPVLERSMQDRFVPLPAAHGPAAAAEAPVFQRAMADHLEQAAPPAFASRPLEQLIAQAPREGSSPAVPPPLEPVPMSQAQQIISDAAQDVQARVEEAIGAADAQWAEMDFPARVVKLKIENDKVRVKLDELENMAQTQRR